MLLIGESINGTIQKVGQAILERNETFLRTWHEFNMSAELISWMSMQGWPAGMRWRIYPGWLRPFKKKFLSL